MASCWYVMVVFAIILVHATARDIPSTNQNVEVVAVAPQAVETENVVTAHEPAAAAGVKDEKNFIAYGGAGGFAGVGGYVGVLPALGGVAGAGGPGGLGGGAGGAGGVGGLGGLGGMPGGGVVGGIGKVIGGGIGGGVMPLP